MKEYKVSIACSTIIWAIIILLTGVFGHLAFMIGLIALKVIGAVLLLAILIRIPIVLMEREADKNYSKLRNNLEDKAKNSLQEMERSIKQRSTIEMVGRDHPMNSLEFDE